MNDTARQPETIEPEASELVPEFWPPADPSEPVRAWRIHWLLAPLATIPAALLPRRMGPHLANSSWTAAYVAHVFSGVVAVGILFSVAMRYQGAGEPTLASVFLGNPLVELRRALAGAVLLLYGVWDAWLPVLGTWLAIAAIEVGIWAGALALIPLYAVGEGARRTYGRCVRLVLWSSACQMPIAWLFMHFGLWADEHLGGEIWAMPAWATCELWWLWVVVRLGGRYGGPKEGPRWQDRRPHCEDCGYSLVSLPNDGRCPECGVAVTESLPERRRPPAFATARGLRGRFVDFWKTTWQAMNAQRFARNLAVWKNHRAARVYVLMICLLVGLIAAATSIAVYAVTVESPSPEQPGQWLGEYYGPSVDVYLSGLIAVAITCAICGASVPAVWMLTTGMFLSRFGFRDMADRVAVLCYATAWLLVPVLLTIAGGWAAYGVIETSGPFHSFRVAEDTWIDWEAVLWIGCLLPAAVTFVMSFLRIRVMLRHTRYANA